MFIRIFILVILTLIKAIFSAGDTAFTYVNKSKISQMSKTNKKAKRIKILAENSTRFFGTIEVAITMCELLASVYAFEMFLTPISVFLTQHGISSNTALLLSVIIVTVILSYFLLVFGAILPKRIAKNHPEKTAFRVVNVLWFVAILNKPFEKLISASTKFFSYIFRVPEEPKEKLTEKEIKMMIREGKDQGVIAEIEKDILIKTLRFNDLYAKDIMIIKEKIDFINIDDSIDEILENIKKYNYTRMPVFQENKNNVIGLFNIKDIIIEYANKKRLNLHIKHFLRPVLFVKEKDKVSDIFQIMQKEKQALAIVQDEGKKVVRFNYN